MWPSSTAGAEKPATTSTKVMTNADIIFNVFGDIEILNLFSECITPNGVALTTMQYNCTPTVGTATPISGASASLASATAGTIVTLDGTTLATAPTITPAGVSFGQIDRGIIMTRGTIGLVIATGPTTGTWKHYLRYRPLEDGAYVTGV